MLFCHLLIFFKINFLENSFRNTIRVSNSLDPDQAGCFMGPDLGLNCLQRLSEDDTGRQGLISLGGLSLSVPVSPLASFDFHMIYTLYKENIYDIY